MQITEGHTPSYVRLWLAAAVVCACAAMLLLRWVNLQVENFSRFSEMAHENQVKLLPMEPRRGLIYDRHGEPLVGSTTTYSLRVASDFASAVLGKLDILTTAIHLQPEVVKQLRSAAETRVYKGNIILREQLNEEDITNFLGWQFLFPEIVLDANLVRTYPYADSGGHVLGFVGRINAKDEERLKTDGESKAYRGAKFIGKTGVELINEAQLRGRLGSQEAQVDAHGRILRSRVIEQPVPGQDVYLTLDWGLQQLAEKLLLGERGAAVMMDIHSGELLVLASSPRFDINQFVLGISHDDWNVLNTSQEKPLIHRAIYGQYAPGSTIKPFIALSSLEKGWRELSYTYFSRGFFQLSPKHIFHDWKKGGHGEVDVGKSIIRSVNSYYYQLGHDVGIDALHEALALFGFGQETGIDLDNEKPGVLPSEQWKRDKLNDAWYPGDTVAASVGQGYMQVTPLQIARAMAMLANGGRRVQPYLVRRPRGREAVVTFAAPHLLTVQTALAAVTRPGGTAAKVGQGAAFGIAGKTGTAQVSRLRRDAAGERIKNEDLPKHLRDHAWFVGYAPVHTPQVAIAVIVENSGSGGRVAGPVVRQLLDAYMQDHLHLLPQEAVQESDIPAPAAEVEVQATQAVQDTGVQEENV